MDTLIGTLMSLNQKGADYTKTQQQIQENNLLLQSKVAGLQQQEQMRKVWSQYNPADPQALDRMAQQVGQINPADGLALLKESTQSKLQQSTMFKNQIDATGKLHTQAGGMAGAALSGGAAGYQALIPQLRALGVTSLSGDFAKDQTALLSLAQGSVPYGKQIDQAAKVVDQTQKKLSYEATLAHYGDMKVHYDQAKTGHDTDVAFREQRQKDIVMAQTQKQTGVDLKTQTARQRLAIPSKLQVDSAVNMIAADPDFASMSPIVRTNIAKYIASKASTKLANNMKTDSPDWTVDDYYQNLSDALAEGRKDGTIKVTPGPATYLGFGAPDPAKASATVNPQVNKVTPQMVTSYSTQDSVLKDMKSGKITKEQGLRIAQKKGWVSE